MVQRLGFADWAKEPGQFRGRFEGKDLGTNCTVLFVRIEEPDKGPPLHTHPYDEIFIVREGRARFTIGDETTDAGPGDILLVPAGVPHTFRTLPGGVYASTDIHLSAEWIQTDLE